MFCSIVAGCGGSPEPVKPVESKDPVYGGIYRRAFSDSFLTLDPSFVGDSFSHELCRQMFDSLIEFDEEGKVVPSLAKAWSLSEDHLTYTVRLRNDVRFHATTGADNHPTANGGRLMGAEDVEYTFRRLLDPAVPGRKGKIFSVISGAAAYQAGKASSIAGIKVTASDTIEFTLEKPFAPFLSLLALSNAFIVPREDAEALKDGYASAPVGTGPFLWGGQREKTIVLKANPNYFRGRPYLDGIEFPVIEDETERFKAFRRGEFMQADVPDPEYKNIKQDPVLSPYFQEVSRWGVNYLGFNVQKPPFDNVKVRQAINYAVDREAIVKLILNDRARVAKGILPPGIPAYNAAVRGYSLDIDKAKALLTEAGYPDGKGFPEITLWFNRESIHSRTAEFILANLRDVGINCNVHETDFKDHLQAVESGEASFFRMGWTVDYPDPDDFLYALFHSKNVGPGGNFTRYSNPQVDEVLEKARFEIDPKRRNTLYQRAEQMILDEAPWVVVFHYTTHVIVQPYVHGLKLTPMGSPFIPYRSIWMSPQTH
ncbi:hypothetical protein AUK22_11215 [bacterium CG2_30_54_10]|nr:MAG: hypothetical protein AUK22_11215 [bacterium CG2_30_54_10]